MEKKCLARMFTYIFVAFIPFWWTIKIYLASKFPHQTWFSNGRILFWGLHLSVLCFLHKLLNNYLLALESISSTVKVQIFCTNVILSAFSTVHVTRKAAETTFVRKTRAQNRWWNWHLVTLDIFKQNIAIKRNLQYLKKIATVICW